MKMTVEAKLKYIDTDGVTIGVGIVCDHVNEKLIPEFYIAMLRGMRDAREKDFHLAMITFIEEELRQ